MTRGISTRVKGPPAGVVEVWTVALDPPAEARERLLATLDPEENEQAAMVKGGEEWALAHGALRTILAGYLDVGPGTLRFTRGAAGKPRLANVRGLEFSFARTDGLAMIAAASDRRVGIDVERVNERTDIDAVAKEYLSPIDAAAIEMSPPEGRRSAFFQAWARHEARLKLRGEGLREQVAGETVESGSLVVVRVVATKPGFAAAVAAEGGSWTVRIRELFGAP